MRTPAQSAVPATLLAAALCPHLGPAPALAQQPSSSLQTSSVQTSSTLPDTNTTPLSPQYRAVQQRLARGWNTWDVHSVTTHVPSARWPRHPPWPRTQHHRVPQQPFSATSSSAGSPRAPSRSSPAPTPGTAATPISASPGRAPPGACKAPTSANDLVLLATPARRTPRTKPFPPTLVFSVDLLWNAPGSVSPRDRHRRHHRARPLRRHPHLLHLRVPRQHSSSSPPPVRADLPIAGPYFAADLTAPVAISTGKPRSVAEVQAALEQAHTAYIASLPPAQNVRPIHDAIQTTLGWDTIYEPTKQRVISPVSRIWSVDWGGYVLFDWDTFFASTMASLGDRDLAYADTIETLREITAEGFVPNYARGGNWKSFDRSEPPVGAITVLGLYRKFGDPWLLQDTFPALLSWNRWWDRHRSLDGYLIWGSDGNNPPGNLDDNTRGTLKGAILESGLDNSPMYDGAGFNAQRHQMELADVGLLSLYLADCDALATIADTLHRPSEASELRDRSRRYGAKLQTLWSPEAGIFLNKDLRDGQLQQAPLAHQLLPHARPRRHPRAGPHR